MVRSLVLFVFVAMPLVNGLVATPAGAQQRLAGSTAVQHAAGDGDAQLHRFATEHARRGDWVTAMQALAGVADGAALANALDAVKSAFGEMSADVQGAAGSAEPSGPGLVQGAAGGPGGSPFANFAPLIDLIQTSIAPDMWEEAGGAGTIRPYPGGIVVDSSGLVTDIAAAQSNDHLLADIAVLLAQESHGTVAADASAVQSWRLPSRHRCVSLQGVARQVLRHRLSGVAIDDALRHLAGLSRVDYVVLLPERRDVILIGPVGGIETHQGWFRDRRSGLPVMRLDFFTACATAMVADQPLGCSIDPTPQSLAAAAKVSEAIRGREIPIGLAANALRQALGEQSIRVFGIAGDTPLAYLMVEADRHMKQLSLGLEPMPRGVGNYLDMVTRHIDRGPPDGQLLRLWFTASPMAVRMSSDARVYQLGGRPMKLASETQLAGPRGDRLASPDDVRLVEFVNEFNQNLDEIIRTYPAYGALQSVYHAAAIAEVLRRSDAQPWIAELLAPLLLDDASAGVMSVPKRVDSIAVSHRVKHDGRRHFILLASGGVRVESAGALLSRFETYPAIDPLTALAEPPADPRWWWDAQ